MVKNNVFFYRGFLLKNYATYFKQHENLIGAVDKSFCVMDVVPTAAEPRESKTLFIFAVILCNSRLNISVLSS